MSKRKIAALIAGGTLAALAIHLAYVLAVYGVDAPLEDWYPRIYADILYWILP